MKKQCKLTHQHLIDAYWQGIGDAIDAINTDMKENKFTLEESFKRLTDEFLWEVSK